jgi:hypothetical protein
MKIEIDFTQHSVEELKELQNKIGHYLHDMNDGSSWRNTVCHRIILTAYSDSYSS